METETSKRKKRKTRRCLDEMRKRSRGNTNNTDKNEKVNLNNGRNIGGVNLSHLRNMNNSITKQRITLTKLPKSIRSETITRPAIIGNNNQELHIINHEIKNLTSGSPVTNNNVTKEQNWLSGNKYKQNSGTISILSDKENFSDIQETSPNSLVLFSPMVQTVKSDTFEDSIISESISTLTTPSSSQSSREGYGYHLYVDFMNEIPKILKDTAPALIKEDVMKRTKNLLHNIYVEDCRQESEDNVMQCIKSSVLSNQKPSVCQNVVDQNPMEYLKFGYAWQKSIPCLESRCEQSMTNSSGSLEVSSECESASDQAISPHSPPGAFSYDTPDYNYYPHKLNQ